MYKTPEENTVCGPSLDTYDKKGSSTSVRGPPTVRPVAH